MTTPVSFAVRKTANRKALLLVHGFGGESYQTFGMLPAFLAGSSELFEWDIHCIGYPTSLAPDITGVWSADPDLASLAGWLANTIDNGRYAAYPELGFIAHSMGGLIVQRALLDGGFLERVRMVALFGTPSNGLRKARLAAIFKRQVRDMRAKAPFITGLRADWTARFVNGLPFRFVAATGLKDEFVPETSSIECFPAPHHQRVPGDHLQMVKPRRADDDVPLLLLNLLARGATGQPAPDVLPVETSAAAATARAATTNTLSTDELVNLALAFELAGGQQRAIDLLESRHAGNTELTGVLAGRLKRRWLADPEGNSGDGPRAYELYRAAFEQAAAAHNHAQAYYNGINVAFMALALTRDHPAAVAAAQQVVGHCEAACRRGSADRWLLATEGEASLYGGDHAAALRLYREAFQHIVEERERGSMLRQGIWVCRLLGARETEAQLKSLYARASAGFPDMDLEAAAPTPAS